MDQPLTTGQLDLDSLLDSMQTTDLQHLDHHQTTIDLLALDLEQDQDHQDPLQDLQDLDQGHLQDPQDQGPMDLDQDQDLVDLDQDLDPMDLDQELPQDHQVLDLVALDLE